MTRRDPAPLIPDEVPPPASAARTRPWARLLLLMLLLCATGLFAIWYAQQRLLAYACENIASLTRQPLHCSQASGTLPGTLRAEVLRWSSDDLVIELRGVRLRPSLSWLAAGRLSLREASVREFNVFTLRYSGKPLKLPTNMALPLPLDIQRAQVQTLNIYDPQGHALVFTHLQTRARLDRLLWTVEEAKGEFLGLQMHGRASMNTRKPYALGGSIQLRRAWQNNVLQATLEARGELDRVVELEARGQLNKAPAVLKAQMTLTGAHTIASATAQVNNWPLHEWIPGLPPLPADVHASALPDAEGWGGYIEVSNLQPGALDRQRIPASSASGNWHWQGGTSHLLQLDDLRLQLPGKGRLQGKLRWNGRLHIEGRGSQVDLAQIWSTLHRTQLQGPFALTTRDYHSYEVSGDLRQGQDRLQLRGQVDAQRARVEHLLWQRAGSAISGQGEVGFAQPIPLKAELRLRQLNPAVFGHFPAGSINGRLRVHGQARAPLRVHVEADIQNSRLYDAPLLVRGRGRYTPDELQLQQTQLQIGGLQAQLDGHLGTNGRMQVQASMQGRQAWWPELAGNATLRGVLTGSLRSPGFSGAFNGSALQYAQWRAGNLQLEVEAAPGFVDALQYKTVPQAQLQMQAVAVGYQSLAIGRLRASASLAPAARAQHIAVQAQELKYDAQSLDDLTVQLDGPLAAHKLKLELQRPRQRLQVEARGALDLRQSSWSGQLQDLEARGRLPVKLLAPARVQLSPDRVELGPLQLLSGKGTRVDIDSVRWQGNSWSSQGRMSRLPLREIIILAGRQPPQLDLVLGGDWQLQYDGVLNGRVRLERESGDIQPLEDIQGLGLNRGVATLDIANNHLHGELDIRSQSAGRIQGHIDSDLTERDGQLGLAGNAPIKGALQVDMPSLDWVGKWFSTPGYNFGGVVQGQVGIGGTVAEPLLNGTLQARRLTARISEYGLDWRNGEIDATVENDRILFNRLSIQGGNGSLQGNGLLSLRKSDPDIAVELRAQRMTVLGRPDQKLVISGTGKAHLLNQHLAIQGDIRVDDGLLTLKSNVDDVLDDDIVQTRKQARRQAGQTEARRIGLFLSTKVDLGRDFKVRNRSFNAEATGVLRMESSPQRPAILTGNVAVDKGHLYAYGQKLSLQPGSSLNFNGPPDNPAFNLRAYRDNLPLNTKTGEAPKVGVNVVGTARKPVLKLISEPEMTDREKLSLLIFGQDLQQSRGNNTQLTVLSTAATAIYSELGDGSGNFINDTVGLDELTVEQNTGDVSKGVVRLGKQLVPNLYVSFGKGYNGARDELQLNYLFNQKWSMEIKSSETSSVDIFYTISFD